MAARSSTNHGNERLNQEGLSSLTIEQCRKKGKAFADDWKEEGLTLMFSKPRNMFCSPMLILSQNC